MALRRRAELVLGKMIPQMLAPSPTLSVRSKGGCA